VAEQFESIRVEAKFERRYVGSKEFRRLGAIVERFGLVEIQQQNPVWLEPVDLRAGVEWAADPPSELYGPSPKAIAVEPDRLGAGQLVHQNEGLIQQIALFDAGSKTFGAGHAIRGLKVYAQWLGRGPQVVDNVRFPFSPPARILTL
jgi:hypothetical protein